MIDSGDDPAYVRVAQLLESWIRSGEPGYRPGWVLPTADRLARELGLGPRTVAASYRLLSHMGVLSIRPGYGAVVREAREREVIEVPPGTTVSTRMPTFAEMREWSLEQGVPMLVVDGRPVPGDRFEVKFTQEDDKS